MEPQRVSFDKALVALLLGKQIKRKDMAFPVYLGKLTDKDTELDLCQMVPHPPNNTPLPARASLHTKDLLATDWEIL